MKTSLAWFRGLITYLLIVQLSSGAESKLPNIVFILADDLGYAETGCYGQKKIRTPNIDQLAAGGMRFTQAYTGAPVCAPARCTLMTGKHGGHAQIGGNLQAKVHFPDFKEGQYPIDAGTITLASVLKKAGYTTGAFGKWGLGPAGSTGDPLKQGFDRFYGYNCQAVAHSYYPKYLWDNDKQVEINPKPIPGHAKKPEGDVQMSSYIGQQYASHLIRREALSFIDQNKDKPFFLYLPFIEPHVAMHPPQDLVNEYPAEWDKETYRGECSYLPHPRPRAAYAAMITDLDRHVGAVMESLKKHGLLENTLVIFTSDNGTTHPLKKDSHFNVGGVDAEFFNSLNGLKGFKGSLHEGGIRIPYIASFPGRIKAGGTTDFPTYFPDQFPTLCDLAGVPMPHGLDGISILPVLRGNEASVKRNPMVWVYPEYGGQVAVRIGGFKVMRTGLKTKKPTGWQVYDIVKDPNETKDLAAERPELIKEAKSILESEWKDNQRFPMSKARALN